MKEMALEESTGSFSIVWMSYLGVFIVEKQCVL